MCCLSSEDIQSFLSFDLETYRRKRMKNTPQDDPIDCYHPQLELGHLFSFQINPQLELRLLHFLGQYPRLEIEWLRRNYQLKVRSPLPTGNPLPLSQAGNPLPSFHQAAPQTHLPSSHQLAEAPLLSNQNSSLAIISSDSTIIVTVPANFCWNPTFRVRPPFA